MSQKQTDWNGDERRSTVNMRRSDDVIAMDRIWVAIRDATEVGREAAAIGKAAAEVGRSAAVCVREVMEKYAAVEHRVTKLEVGSEDFREKIEGDVEDIASYLSKLEANILQLDKTLVKFEALSGANEKAVERRRAIIGNLPEWFHALYPLAIAAAAYFAGAHAGH